MMRKLNLILLVLGILLISGCSAPNSVETPTGEETSSKDVVIYQTEPEISPEGVDPGIAGPPKPVASDSFESEPISEEFTEPAETDIHEAEITSPPVVSEPTHPKQESPKETLPQQSQEAPATPTVPTVPAEPAKPTEPEPTQDTEPVPEETKESETEFDVSKWVSFAKEYGLKLGLSYDDSATDCWDNPILASSKSIYLERDITSRLNRYANGGMTAFCVWAELRSDGRYDIYIGYA